MRIRERFRRFILSRFDGVPYEEYERMYDACEHLDDENQRLKQEIERKNSQVSFSLIDTNTPVKVRAQREYTKEEAMSPDAPNHAWNEIAQEFMPAVLDNMRRMVKYDPIMSCFSVSAELWLYPLGNKGEQE